MYFSTHNLVCNKNLPLTSLTVHVTNKESWILNLEKLEVTAPMLLSPQEPLWTLMNLPHLFQLFFQALVFLKLPPDVTWKWRNATITTSIRRVAIYMYRHKNPNLGNSAGVILKGACLASHSSNIPSLYRVKSHVYSYATLIYLTHFGSAGKCRRGERERKRVCCMVSVQM